jgi:hypothetical protein
VHPYQVNTPIQPYYCFPVANDPRVFAVARKLRTADRWLLCALAESAACTPPNSLAILSF